MVPGSSWESRSGTLGGAELGLIIKLKRKSSAKKAFKLGWIECTPAADNSSTHFQFSRKNCIINNIIKKNPAILSNMKSVGLVKWLGRKISFAWRKLRLNTIIVHFWWRNHVFWSNNCTFCVKKSLVEKMTNMIFAVICKSFLKVERIGCTRKSKQIYFEIETNIF